MKTFAEAYKTLHDVLSSDKFERTKPYLFGLFGTNASETAQTLLGEIQKLKRMEDKDDTVKVYRLINTVKQEKYLGFNSINAAIDDAIADIFEIPDDVITKVANLVAPRFKASYAPESKEETIAKDELLKKTIKNAFVYLAVIVSRPKDPGHTDHIPGKIEWLDLTQAIPFGQSYLLHSRKQSELAQCLSGLFMEIFNTREMTHFTIDECFSIIKTFRSLAVPEEMREIRRHQTFTSANQCKPF